MLGADAQRGSANISKRERWSGRREVPPFDRAKPHLIKVAKNVRLRVNLGEASIVGPARREVHYLIKRRCILRMAKGKKTKPKSRR